MLENGLFATCHLGCILRMVKFLQHGGSWLIISTTLMRVWFGTVLIGPTSLYMVTSVRSFSAPSRSIFLMTIVCMIIVPIIIIMIWIIIIIICVTIIMTINISALSPWIHPCCVVPRLTVVFCKTISILASIVWFKVFIFITSSLDVIRCNLIDSACVLTMCDLPRFCVTVNIPRSACRWSVPSFPRVSISNTREVLAG